MALERPLTGILGATLEWKNPVSEPFEVLSEHVDGISCTSFSPFPDQGWVRLQLRAPRNGAGVAAVRALLKFKGDKAEHKVKICIATRHNKTFACKSIEAAPATNLKLGNDVWFDLTGVFACGPEFENREFVVNIDLPNGVTIFVADAHLNWLSAEFDPIVDSGEVIRSVHEFKATSVSNIVDWIASPPVYGSDIIKSGDQYTGHFITELQKLYVNGQAGESLNEISLDLPFRYNGLVMPNGGFNCPAAKNASPQFRVVKTPVSVDPVAIFAEQSTALKVKAKKGIARRDRQENAVLIWAPISTSGLTVQLEQIAAILINKKIPFYISYHMQPTVEHELVSHWIHPRDIDQPKLVIYMERMYQFDRGFESAYKVFYMNLDWLAPSTLALARMHANLVICPTPYRIEEMSSLFPNAKVHHLPWPANFAPTKEKSEFKSSDKIRVLYVGNDYDGLSRKHPMQVVEAIEKLERNDLTFDLKFRSPLPGDVKSRLLGNPRIKNIIDWPTDHSAMKALYEDADINLIPNACEGNGLSILESWASGTVPAVLNGNPMSDVTTAENSYRIHCEEVGSKEFAPLYSASGSQILDFLQSVDRNDLSAKKDAVHEMYGDLIGRQAALEDMIMSAVLMSGYRSKPIRQKVENCHLPLPNDANWEPRAGARVKNLLISGSGKFRKPARLVDVIMTTSNRPWFFRDTLARVLHAIRASPYEHRLSISVDGLDAGTLAILNQHVSEIDQVLWTKDQRGLPFSWNSSRDLLRNTICRTEKRPDFVCYIQDDCYIREPDKYFEVAIGLAEASFPGYLGFVSGFYTEVHPGFAEFEWNGNRVIASDSVDGKNFIATPEVLEGIGALTWHFGDGMKRGNPGPVRGSHFDLWQWKESPNSLTWQSRVTLVLPDLCGHIAAKASHSTWSNDTTDAATQDRIAQNRVYQTRKYG
ncbi:hypothetical protein [Sphingomonas sp. VDB2]|uniref:hypothetical protein n=1 Tax=Sphingomonas sp. VDB2 TaxID=3228751 RepID=UPI003A801F52